MFSQSSSTFAETIKTKNVFCKIVLLADRTGNDVTANEDEILESVKNEVECQRIARSALQFCEYASVPEVYFSKGNLIVMELVNGASIEDCKDHEERFDLILPEIEKLFFEAGLVHNDLQYYNVLWDGNKFWIIDFGMAKNL